MRVLDAALATEFAIGDAVTGTLDPANSTQLYRFTGTAGEKLYFDNTSLSGGDTYWRLLDPFGRTVWTQVYMSTDVPGVVLAHDGEYTLMIEGRYYLSGGTSSYAFNVQRIVDADAATLAIGAIVDATIAQKGETDRYTFTLAETTRVYFDSLTTNAAWDSWYLRWALTGPDGAIVSDRPFRQSDSYEGLSLMTLGPGEYTLTVNTVAEITGAYRFRLLDVGAPLEVDTDTVVNGTLDPSNGTLVYAFDATAGQRFFFSGTSSGGDIYWRLLDSAGRTVFGPSYLNDDVDVTTLGLGGRYTLLVEGRYYTSGTAGFSFNVQSATDEFLTLTMNVPQTQTIATPGQRDFYRLELTEATLVYFDSQTTNAAFDSWNLRWDLTGAQGTLVSDRPFRQSDSYEGTSILLLQPGEYTLGVRGVGAQTGAYTFRLLDLTHAPTITTGAAISGTLNPANETEAYRFAANAGDRYFFDRTANSGGDTYWRLLDPFGRTVWGPTYMPNNDVDVTTLAFDGDYTLLIEGRYYVGGTASYAFNVQPTPITERVIITGLGTVPGPDLQVENLVITPDGDALLSGGQVTIAWDVVNRGSEPANAPWLDRVLVRNTDRGEIIGNVLVEYADLGDIADDPLAPGERRSRTATLTLPAGNRGAGNLRFEVLADVSNVVTELGAGGLAELNNSASLVRDVALAPYPDLRVAGLSVTPAGGFVPGAEVTVRWNVVNAGDAAVTAGWKIGRAHV